MPPAGHAPDVPVGRRDRLLVALLSGVCLAALARLLATAFGYGVPAWFDEELNPLIGHVVDGQPITQIDPRQYGVVVFLVFDPALRLLGPNLPTLASYALMVALLSVVAAFALVARRYARDDLRRVLVLATLWASAVPLLYVIAQRMVDAWQLLFVSAALFLFTGSRRQRWWAGLPLAAATLTKLLPGLVLLYVCVRAWRAALIGLVGIGALLGLGQLMYGPLLGFGYPLAMLRAGGDTVARWSTHFENNSIRGLLYKLAAGFQLEGDTTGYALSPDRLPLLNALAYALAAGLVGYLLLVAWRGRGRESLTRRSIEFSLAVVTMLLVSPHTAQDYLVTMLPVLSVWAWLWTTQQPARWSLGQTLLGLVSAVLIGVFIPMNLVARVLPFGWLLSVTHNAQNAVFSDQIGSAIGAYDFFGLPGLGLILAWLLLVRLERQTASDEAVLPAPAAQAGATQAAATAV